MYKHYKLNVNVVSEALEQQSLKKWWVAEYSGIHRTTFRRWLSGKTRFVLKKNAENLAVVLQRPLTELARPVQRTRINTNRYSVIRGLDG